MSDRHLEETLSIAEAVRRLRHRIDERDKEKLTIALVGRSGSGKSTLINRMVGRKVCDVGVRTDFTTTASHHQWRPSRHDSGQVSFVDLPGYGTQEFSLSKVMSEFDIKQFDVFLWCANGKFLEEDLSIYQELERSGKPIILVRTQADNIFDDEKSAEDLEMEIEKDLSRLLGREIRLFFVSGNPQYSRYRERLASLISAIEEVVKETSGGKAGILYLEFRALSEEFLEKKRASVEEMVLTHSLLAAANGVNIIPGLNIGVDLANVVKMLDRISSSYGIDEIAKAKILGEPPAWLLGARNVLQSVARDGALTLLKSVGGPLAAKSASSVIPILGLLISAGVGFMTVRSVGNKHIDDCHGIASKYMSESRHLHS